MSGSLPEDAAARTEYPMADGLLYYFPAALAEVARVSKIGNDQHNPGQPMHWARGKSTDHANKIMRHLVDAGTLDKDGTRHTAKVAWRALALLQEELEAAGAPLPRNARLPELVPHDLAAAMLRDGVVAAPTIEKLPPNCDGNNTHHAVEAPMPPALDYVDFERDDDEGAPGEPPRCSTGGCGEG